MDPIQPELHDDMNALARALDQAAHAESRIESLSRAFAREHWPSATDHWIDTHWQDYESLARRVR